MQRTSRGAAPEDELRIPILFNDTSGVQRGFPSDDLPDQDADAVEPIAAALRELGHQVSLVPCTFRTMESLPERVRGADAVFNLCDGSGVDGHVGPSAPALLQQLNVPYTGVNADCYLLTSDKAGMKARLEEAGVPVPRGQVMAGSDVPMDPRLRYPLFVKPREGFGSLGIDAMSVARDEAEVRAAVARLLAGCDGDAIVEEYIEGREITVGLLGGPERPTMLPPVEVCFGEAFSGKPQIRTLTSKHDPNSPEYHAIRVVQAELEPAQAERLRQVALDAWRAVGGDGYGRVDIRLAKDGTPYVLEVNGNCSLEIGPALADCSMMVLAARLQGLTDAQLVDQVLQAGLRRQAPRNAGVRSAVSARWVQGVGFSLHALRPLQPDEDIAEVETRVLAGAGAARPWRIAGQLVAPDPPVRYARGAEPTGAAHAELVRRDDRLVVRMRRAVPLLGEVRVARAE